MILLCVLWWYLYSFFYRLCLAFLQCSLLFTIALNFLLALLRLLLLANFTKPINEIMPKSLPCFIVQNDAFLDTLFKYYLIFHIYTIIIVLWSLGCKWQMNIATNSFLIFRFDTRSHQHHNELNNVVWIPKAHTVVSNKKVEENPKEKDGNGTNLLFFASFQWFIGWTLSHGEE